MSIKTSKKFAGTLIVALVIFGAVVLIGQNEHRPVTSPDARRLEPELRRIWYWLSHWDKYETLPRVATEYSHCLYVHEDTVEACFYVDGDWHCLPFDEFMIRGAVSGLDTLIAGYGILGDNLAHGDTVAVDSSILGEGGADSLYAGRYLLKNSETNSSTNWLVLNGDTVHVDTSFMEDEGIPWEGVYDTTMWDYDKNIVYIFPTSDTSVTDNIIHNAMGTLEDLATVNSSWTAVLMNGIHRPDEGWAQPSYVTCIGQSERTIVLNKPDDESWDDDDEGWTEWDDYIDLSSYTVLRGIFFEDSLGQASGRGGVYYIETNNNSHDIVIEECEFYLPYFHRAMNLAPSDSNVVVRNCFIGKHNSDSYKDYGRWDGQYCDGGVWPGSGDNIRVEGNVFESWCTAIYLPDIADYNEIGYAIHDNVFKRCNRIFWMGASLDHRQSDDTLWVKTYDNQYYRTKGVVFDPYYKDPLYIWKTNESHLTWPANARVEIYGRDFYKNESGDSVSIKTIYQRIYSTGIESEHIKNNTIEWRDLSETLRGIIFGDSAKSEYRLRVGCYMSFDSIGVDIGESSIWRSVYHGIDFKEYHHESDDDFYVHPWDSIEAGLGNCIYANEAADQALRADPDTLNNDYFYPSDGFYTQFWVRFKSLPTEAGEYHALIYKGKPWRVSSDGKEWGFGMFDDDALEFWTSPDSVNTTEIRTINLGFGTFETDTTYFVAGWYDADSSQMCFTMNPYDSVYKETITGVYDGKGLIEIAGRYYNGNSYDEANAWFNDFIFFPGLWPSVEDNYQMAKDFYDAGLDSTVWDSSTVAQYDSTNIADGGLSVADFHSSVWDSVDNMITGGGLVEYLVGGYGIVDDSLASQDTVEIDTSVIASRTFAADSLFGGYGIVGTWLADKDTVVVDTNDIATKAYVDKNAGGGGTEPSYYEVQIDSAEMDSESTTITYYNGYGIIDSFFYVMSGGESLNVDLMGDSSRANSNVIKNLTLTDTTYGETITDIGAFPGFLWLRCNNADSKPEELWGRLWISPTTEFEVEYEPILFAELDDTTDWTETYTMTREADAGHQLVHFQDDTAYIDSAMRTNEKNWLQVEDSDTIDWNKSWCVAGWFWMEYVGWRQMVRVRVEGDDSQSCWWIGNAGQYTTRVVAVDSTGTKTINEMGHMNDRTWRFFCVWWDAGTDSIYCDIQYDGSWDPDHRSQWHYTAGFNEVATDFTIGNNWQGYLDAIGVYRKVPKSENKWQMVKDLYNSDNGLEPE